MPIDTCSSEKAELAFAGAPPDAADLSRRWHVLLDAGRQVVDVLPAEEVGKCVLTYDGELFKGDTEDARRSLAEGEILFHAGRIKGAFPQVIESRCPPQGE